MYINPVPLVREITFIVVPSSGSCQIIWNKCTDSKNFQHELVNEDRRQNANREHVIMALADLDEILVRATHVSNQRHSRFVDWQYDIMTFYQILASVSLKWKSPSTVTRKPSAPGRSSSASAHQSMSDSVVRIALPDTIVPVVVCTWERARVPRRHVTLRDQSAWPRLMDSASARWERKGNVGSVEGTGKTNRAIELIVGSGTLFEIFF